MNEKQIEQAFRKIDYEIRFNKPDSTPYLPDLVKEENSYFLHKFI